MHAVPQDYTWECTMYLTTTRGDVSMHAVPRDYTWEFTLYHVNALENARRSSWTHVRMHSVPPENVCCTSGLHVRMHAVPRDYTWECTLYLGTTRENARCTSGIDVRMHAVSRGLHVRIYYVPKKKCSKPNLDPDPPDPPVFGPPGSGSGSTS